MTEAIELDDAARFTDRWWNELWGEGKIALVDQLVAPVHLRHSTSGSRRIDREEFKIELVQHQRILHRPVSTVDALTVTGDVIWSRVVTRGANLDTGQAMTVSWLQQQRLADGLLVESWSLAATGTDWAVTDDV